MWRTKKDKLILVFNRQENPSAYSADDIIAGEFYDLENDPQEWDDLYETPKVSALRKEYTAAILKQPGDM